MRERFLLDATTRRERVDKLLVRLLGDVSRVEVQRWIKDGRVLVDGSPCRPKSEVGAGAVLTVERAAPPALDVAPDGAVPFDVLFEDEHLIVVDKPAGVVVHPAKGNWGGTLIAGLLARPSFGRPPSDDGDPGGALRPGIVHRIDKDTSGILVVAKTALSREALKRQFSAHTITRRYAALTMGAPEPGRITTQYGRHPRSRVKFTSQLRDGKTAITEVRTLEKLGGGRAALVECVLQTGRTHQIRVHLSEQRNTPLLADSVYGRVSRDPLLARAATAIGRQALHAELLGFEHPVTRVPHEFTSALPADFHAALQVLREGS